MPFFLWSPTNEIQTNGRIMTIGVIGTGAIAAAIVEGLSTDEKTAPEILLSPRNAEIAASLAARFANVSVAASNQAVLDGADMVLIAVRPQVAADVLKDLTFRADHHVVSLMAIIGLDEVKAMVSPAEKVTRVIPLPSTAQRMGPTPVYPPDTDVAALFNSLGVAIEVKTAAEFDALSAATASMASVFTFAETIAQWLAGQGIPYSEARRFVATMMRGLTNTAMLNAESSFAALADEHTTAGGINEQVLRHLKGNGAFDRLSEGLDAVLKRFKDAVG
jgi:pyrroline-5-carboxylate reductase